MHAAYTFTRASYDTALVMLLSAVFHRPSKSCWQLPKMDAWQLLSNPRRADWAAPCHLYNNSCIRLHVPGG